MVSTPLCPGVDFQVIVDGQPLHEFEDSEETEIPAKTVVRYIETQDEAEFAVKIKFRRSFEPENDIGVKLSLDDKVVRSLPVKRDELYKRDEFLLEGRTSILGNGSHAIEKFKFNPLSVEESGSINGDKGLQKRLARTGKITITLRYITNIRQSSRKRPLVAKSKAMIGNVPEKELKGSSLSHYVSFSAPSRHEWNFCQSDLLPGEPILKVIFEYRSRASLQTLGVLPHEPLPIPLEERNEDELSQDELRALVRDLKERNAAAAKVKEEAGIKRELPIDLVGENEGTDGEVEFVEERPCKNARKE